MSAWTPGQNRGETNFRSKLTRDDVLDIWRRLQKKTDTQNELAAEYGVSQATINHIRTGRTWGWLTSKAEV